MQFTSTKSYMEQMLALSDNQRPYLSTASRALLLKTTSLSPVSVEKATIVAFVFSTGTGGGKRTGYGKVGG